MFWRGFVSQGDRRWRPTEAAQLQIVGYLACLVQPQPYIVSKSRASWMAVDDDQRRAAQLPREGHGNVVAALQSRDGQTAKVEREVAREISRYQGFVRMTNGVEVAEAGCSEIERGSKGGTKARLLEVVGDHRKRREAKPGVVVIGGRAGA